MASSNRITLTPETIVTCNGTTTSSAVQVNSQNKDVIAVITVTSFTDGTYDTVIEQSYDGTAFDPVALATIPQATAAGIQTISFPATGHLLYIRAVTTAAGTTTGATIQVDLFTDTNRRNT